MRETIAIGSESYSLYGGCSGFEARILSTATAQLMLIRRV